MERESGSARYRVTSRVVGYQRVVEDRAEVIEIPPSVVLVLADGAGGTGGGALAADIVLETVRQRTQAATLPDEIEWCQILSEVDAALALHPTAGQTTAIVATVTPTRLMGASVGDSGAWLITPSGYRSLTSRQYRKPLLGDGGAGPVPFTTDAWDGSLLLASDGLFNYISAEHICLIAQKPDMEEAAASLIESVRLPSGALWDDVSVILCRRTS